MSLQKIILIIGALRKHIDHVKHVSIIGVSLDIGLLISTKDERKRTARMGMSSLQKILGCGIKKTGLRKEYVVCVLGFFKGQREKENVLHNYRFRSNIDLKELHQEDGAFYF
jgi:hypothetical protein